jgi:hypothetical protein
MIKAIALSANMSPFANVSVFCGIDRKALAKNPMRNRPI